MLHITRTILRTAVSHLILWVPLPSSEAHRTRYHRQRGHDDAQKQESGKIHDSHGGGETPKVITNNV